jgi:hypothetical protein
MKCKSEVPSVKVNHCLNHTVGIDQQFGTDVAVCEVCSGTQAVMCIVRHRSKGPKNVIMTFFHTPLYVHGIGIYKTYLKWKKSSYVIMFTESDNGMEFSLWDQVVCQL